ncbi:MAG: methyltransferase domain-containing protein, partial [Firmicutes bacterium]|nr:methyltransferase domain-containing protein [Bacillota bacterium]
GSGNGAVLLLLAGRTEAARVVGLEIQPVLVEMARRSILLNGLAGRAEVRLGDFRRDDALPPEPFDLVVANPPHIPAHGGTRSPLGALAMARHELACTLGEVIRAAARWLKKGGRLVMVHRALRLAEILVELEGARLVPKRLTMVHPRPGVPASLVLVEVHAGARAGLVVMPPIFVRDESGDFTPEMEEVFAGRWPWRS